MVYVASTGMTRLGQGRLGRYLSGQLLGILPSHDGKEGAAMTTNGPRPGASGAVGDAYASRVVAQAWRTGTADRDRVLGPATALMLDLAGVQVGSRVLDVGAGTGDETLLAARRVGPTGHVLATDVHASMLQVAADAAVQAGLGNVET